MTDDTENTEVVMSDTAQAHDLANIRQVIRDALIRNPGASNREIARMTGLDGETVVAHRHEVVIVPDVDRLLELDQRIDAHEGEALRDRWAFGKIMLEARHGKGRLPNGYLTGLADRCGKSTTELKYRALFAERFPTEPELVNAIDQFGSWHQVINVGLARQAFEPDPPRGKPIITPKVIRKSFNRTIAKFSRMAVRITVSKSLLDAVTAIDILVAIPIVRKMGDNLDAIAAEFHAIADELERQLQERI